MLGTKYLEVENASCSLDHDDEIVILKIDCCSVVQICRFVCKNGE